jgi:hypothetical protein
MGDDLLLAFWRYESSIDDKGRMQSLEIRMTGAAE